ncbi:MAG TPA: hypothetical protein VK689_21415 [Armatimonadota bacterium]|nr:hypothetical protein [Armatimonadota bacterium]
MIEFLTHEVPDLPTSVGFAITGTILAIWGVSLVSAAIRQRDEHVRCRFDFWLGLFITMDALWWLWVSYTVARSPDGVPLIWALYFGVSAIVGIEAFRRWARERV